MARSSQLVLRMQLGATVYVGARRPHENESAWRRRTGWRLSRIVAPNKIMELSGPEGDPIRIYEDRGTEIVPDVIVFVGVAPATEENAPGIARVVFRAPREIPILREGAQRDR